MVGGLREQRLKPSDFQAVYNQVSLSPDGRYSAILQSCTLKVAVTDSRVDSDSTYTYNLPFSPGRGVVLESCHGALLLQIYSLSMDLDKIYLYFPPLFLVLVLVLVPKTVKLNFIYTPKTFLMGARGMMRVRKTLVFKLFRFLLAMIMEAYLEFT